MSMSMPFLQIRYIRCSEKIPGLIVAIAGLLTSLWANCILVIICFQDKSEYNQNNYNDNDNYNNYNDNNKYNCNNHENYISKIIYQTAQLTHLIIVLTCTAGLITGLKEKNRSYLLPWLLIKIIELIVLFVGCIMLATNGQQTFIGVMPLGICFLLTGGYFSLCVWDTYSKMNGANRTSLEGGFSLNGPDELPLPIDPPSYDSSLNVNTRT